MGSRWQQICFYARMKIIGISLLLGTGFLVFAQKRDPATTLFDIEVQDEQSARLGAPN